MLFNHYTQEVQNIKPSGTNKPKIPQITLAKVVILTFMELLIYEITSPKMTDFLSCSINVLFSLPQGTTRESFQGR